MSRIRLQLKKGPEVRFISHLDLARTMERALRRARIPVALSQGFNPHPKISFASALAVGTTSEAEFVDIEIEDRLEPADFAHRLKDQLPSGLIVVEAREISGGAPSLMAEIDAALYIIEVTGRFSAEELDRAIERFLARPEVRIHKETKSGPKEVDIRSLILELSARSLPSPEKEGEDGNALRAGISPRRAELHALLRSGGRGSLRPEDLVRALGAAEPDLGELEVERIHRAGLFRAGPGGLVGPWDI